MIFYENGSFLEFKIVVMENVMREFLNEPYQKYLDLEERTFMFAKNVRLLVKRLSKDISNNEDSKQVVRSSGSIGANYIEANENFSNADFAYRIHICRKEAKETVFWLKLLKSTNDSKFTQEFDELISESIQIQKIFGAINQKIKTNKYFFESKK